MCVRVTPGATYFFGAKFKSVAENYSNCQTGYSPDFTCTGVAGSGPTLMPTTSSSSSWTAASTSLTIPTGANSISIMCFLWKGNMDQIYLTPGVDSF